MLTPIEAASCGAGGGGGTLGLFMEGNTTGTTSGTVDALSLSLFGAGAASVGLSGGSVVISVVQDGAGIQGAVGGNTSGTTALVQTGTWTLAGGNNVTLSQVGNAVTISGPNTAAQSNQQIGLFGVSNTTQSTAGTADARSLSFAGAGDVSVGMSGGTIKISGPLQTNQTIGLFAVGNTTQNSSTTIDARSLSFDGLGAATVGFSNGSVQISAPAGGGAAVMSQWPNFAGGAPSGGTGVALYSGSAGAGGASTLTTVSLWVQPIFLEGNLNFNEIRGAAFAPQSNTTTANGGATGGYTVGLYSLNGSTLSFMSSFSHVIQVTFTSGAASRSTAISGTFGGDVNGSGTYSASGTNVTTNTAPFGLNSAQSGIHMIPVLSGTSVRSLAAGEYWAVFGQTVQTAGQQLLLPMFGVVTYPQLGVAQYQDIQLTGATWSGINPMQGAVSTVLASDALWPVSIPTANISSTGQTISSLLSMSQVLSMVRRFT